MNTDRTTETIVEAWLADGFTPTPDVETMLDGVRAGVAATPQRRHRWWPFGRTAAAPVPERGPAPARGFTMFSALKFVTAAVIVALFGGFLLTGVLTAPQDDEVLPAAVSASPTTEAEPDATAAPTEPTEPQDPSVRSDILPGVTLAVEEVEPGVFHVIDDGVRDLHSGRQTDIVAGHDDGIWLLRKNQFFRLGSDAGHGWPNGERPQSDDPVFDIVDHFEVTPDERVWVVHTERVPDPRDDFRDVGVLLSSDGDGWSRVQTPGNDLIAIAVGPDGTLWATWRELNWYESEREMYASPGVGHLGPSGWEPLTARPGVYERLHPTASGVLYAQGCIYGSCVASRYEDGAWSTMEGWTGTWDVAPDDTVWSLKSGFDPKSDPKGLARVAGSTREEWELEDLPDMGLGIALERGGAPISTFRAAPDGSLWASLWQHGPDGDDPPEAGLWTGEQRGERDRYDPRCDGLVRFDGETTDHFLPGRCVTMDIAADGSVWVLTDEDKGKDLYVITPEAVAAAE